jgi:23S rRNA pseudouridine2605 synthase
VAAFFGATAADAAAEDIPGMTLKSLSLRLSKVVSTSGLSRQAARQAIERGRVSVNGKPCRVPGQRVEPHDEVMLSGKSVAYPGDEEQLVSEARVWCYHKPPGLITTHRDPQNRPTVFEALRRDHALEVDTQHLISVGRLDLDSEGLLLLTDTGALARLMELPTSGFVRQYAVQLACSPRHVTPDMFAELREGLVLADDGTQLRPIRAGFAEGEGGGVAPPAAGLQAAGQQTWVHMALTEGKRREIRRAWDTLGFLVTRLVRTAAGPNAPQRTAAHALRPPTPTGFSSDAPGPHESCIPSRPEKSEGGASPRGCRREASALVSAQIADFTLFGPPRHRIRPVPAAAKPARG